MVLCRFYTLLKDLRSADFRVAHVPCKEGWTSTFRMEASVGSLKCWLVFSRFCESRNRRRSGLQVDGDPGEALPKALHGQSCIYDASEQATWQFYLLKQLQAM